MLAIVHPDERVWHRLHGWGTVISCLGMLAYVTWDSTKTTGAINCWYLSYTNYENTNDKGTALKD